MKHLELPIIIGGEVIEKTQDCYTLKYDDLEIKIPMLNDELINEIESIDRRLIHDLSLNEIVTFISKVAKIWMNPEYELRKKLLTYGPMVTGQSVQMYVHNVGVILSMISFKGYLQDMVDEELYNKSIIDEWVPDQNAYIHAEPLGRLLHIISGNVPLAGIFSIVRGILTKNVNIAKLSSRDIVTLLLFIQSFKDIDPDHPITKTTSAIYWDRNNESIMNRFVDNANGMCIWGGINTIRAYKSRSPFGCEVIEYGPKTGVQIIRWDEEKQWDLPLKVARDICLFDQEACLSPQVIYFQGNIDLFIDKLKKGLADYTELWPKAHYDIDHYAHMNYTIKVNQFFQNRCEYSDKLEWLIVHKKHDTKIPIEHPLGRTILIYQFDDVRESVKYISRENQTVGVEPKELAEEIRDELGLRGVSRIANIGYVDAPRMGLVHESNYMSRLVHIIGMERPNSYKYKIYDVPEEYFGQYKFVLNWKKED